MSFLTEIKNKKKLIMIILLTGIVFSSTCFLDIIITTRHGINFWHTLFDGQLSKYYSYNLGLKYLPGYDFSINAVYNILEYVVFAIWDFPLWIYEAVTGNDAMGNALLIFYAKGIVLLFGAGCVYSVKRICLSLGRNEIIGNAVIMLLTSTIILSTVISMGQYDIISLFFILMGVDFYIKKNNKLFILFFALAIPLKLFALLFFVPLLVLREKKIRKILGAIIASCSLYGFSAVIFILCDYNGVSASSSESLLKKMFVNNVDLSLEPVSVFVVFIVGIVIWCYLHDEKDENKIEPLRICLMVSAFAIILPAHPQWLIYSVPFLCILCCSMESNKGAYLFLETIFEASAMLAHLVFYSNVCSANIVDVSWVGTVFGRIAEREQLRSIFDYLRLNGLTEGVNGILKICLALSVISMAILLINLCRSKKVLMSEKIEYKTWMIVRVLCGIGVLIIPYLGYAVFF